MLPHLVGAMGPSPPTISYPSIIRPFSWADMEMPPPIWHTTYLHSAYGFFITFLLCRMAVLMLEVDDAVHAPDTCHTGKVLKFIHIRRVYHHCFCAVGLGKLMGQL